MRSIKHYPTQLLRYNRSKGFTLIELMVVLFIIGIASSFVTLSLGDGNRGQKLQQQSRLLFKSLELAVEEAAFQRKELGIRFDVYTDDGNSGQYQYTWLVYDRGSKLWQELKSEELKKTITLDEILLDIEIEGERLIIGGKKTLESVFEVNEKAKKAERIEPDIYFLSSGEMPNFEIQLTDEQENDAEKVYRIKGNFIGQLSFLLPGDDEDEL